MNKKLTIGSIIYNPFYLLIVSFVVLLSTCYLEFLSPMDKVITVLAYGFGVINFLLFLVCFKFDKFSISVLIFSFFLLLATLVMNHGDLTGFYRYYFNIISYTLYLNLNIKKDAKKTISVLNAVFFILIFINFITIIIYPKGMYSTIRYDNNWFFKYDNTHIFMYIPGLCIALLNAKFQTKKRAKFLCFLELLIVSYCVFYCQSTNSIIGFSVVLMYFLFAKIIHKLNWLNAKTFFYIFVALFFIVVVFRIQEVFSVIIVNLLNKTSTITGRTYIWSETIKLILQKPILGYGVTSNSLLIEYLGNNRYNHAHNTFLDILFKGGLLSLIPFIGILIITVKENAKYKEDVIAKAVSFFLFSAFIMMNFEAREEKIGLYILLLIVYNTKTLISQYKEEGN